MRPDEKNIIYKLFHSVGFRGYVYTYFSSNVVINKLGYEGGNLVPIAVPDTW